MSLRVWIVLFVCVRKVGSEPGQDAAGVRKLRDDVIWDVRTDLSLRSTGDRLSKTSSGSLSIAFQFPTPH